MSKRRSSVLLIALLVLAGVAESVAVNVWYPIPRIPVLQLAYAAFTLAIILDLGRATSPAARPKSAPSWTLPALLIGTVLLTAIVAQFVLQAYPASADEYGYTYVADTLLHGRASNHAFPPDLRDVLETYYIGGRGDERVSQYAPGWPAFLAPFLWAGIPQFANTLAGLIAAWFLLNAMHYVPTSRDIRLALVTLALAAPFTLFNDASLFSHSLTAVALLAIIWLDLRDDSRPTPWNRVGIGIAFSVLLTTRYEAFLIAFLLFVIDGLVRRRLRFIVWALPAAIGAAPFASLLLAYDWAVTGSPLTTTMDWVSPQVGYGLNAMGVHGPHTLGLAVQHTIGWFASWQDFASVLLLPLYAVALWRRIAARTLRWFDLLFPAVVIFFFFFTEDGGFQYGPRYWYIAHVAMPVTIAAGLPATDGFWRIRHWRFDPVRLTAAQLASFAGMTLGFAAFLHLQVDNRLAPDRLAATVAPPAMVLVESTGRRYVSWQGYARQSLPLDYTRNGVGDLGPIVMGADLGDARTALLCTQIPDRAIYRIHLDHIGPGGTIVPVCNGATAPRAPS